MSRCCSSCSRCPLDKVRAGSEGWEEALCQQLATIPVELDAVFCIGDSCLTDSLVELSRKYNKIIPCTWHWGTLDYTAAAVVAPDFNATLLSASTPQNRCGLLFVGDPSPGLVDTLALSAWHAGVCLFPSPKLRTALFCSGWGSSHLLI